MESIIEFSGNLSAATQREVTKIRRKFVARVLIDTMALYPLKFATDLIISRLARW